MVLFYDDDHYAKKASPTGWRKYLRRFIKVTVIFTILLALAMWALSAAGGNSKALRLGIQDYLTDATGYLAQLSKLESMQFFPVTHIQFAELTLHRPLLKDQSADEKSPPEEKGDIPQLKGVSDYYDPGEVVAEIGRADIRMNFWDMFFSRRRFYVLDVRDITLEEGVWLPRRVHLEKLMVEQEGEFPAIVAQGSYGDHKLHISVRTVKTVQGVYEIPDVTQFQAQIGPLQAEGIIDSGGRTSRITFTSLRMGEHTFTGDVALKVRGNRNNLAVTLNTGESALKGDLNIGQSEIDGTITASVLNIDDIKNARAAYDALKTLWGNASQEKMSFGDHKAAVHLIIDKLVQGDAQTQWGNAKADLVVQPYMMQLNNITGLVSGGALKGALSIDATGAGDAQLKADLHLRGWDYARLQTEVTGQADTHLSLTSAGATFDALDKNMKGELVTIAGAGSLTRDTALYWGGGLVNAMLPGLKSDESLKMNCMVSDFDIDGTKATAQTLFMDLSDLTIAGDGALNFKDMTMDIKLAPKPKTLSILDGGVAVRVQGSLSRPKITPDSVSLGKKIGGLLLGTINPAFFALSLTDLGLNESHPCHAYLQKP